MSDDGNNAPGLTVGSLLGIPLGSTASVGATDQSAASAAVPPHLTPTELTAEEGPWTVAAGELSRARKKMPFRPDGVEALTYDNVFGQPVEQVWFGGKVVYALDLGEVDVDPDRVKVAQEYQIVYAVELDERGKLRSEPERVADQLNIYDSVPGMDRYSPIWQFNYVVVPRDYQPNRLRSEGDCLTSGYAVHRSRVFEN
jgi:hypothetical protein